MPSSTHHAGDDELERRTERAGVTLRRTSIDADCSLDSIFLTSLNLNGSVWPEVGSPKGQCKMRQSNGPSAVLLMAAAIVTAAAVAFSCPLGMMAHAQMSQMMGHDTSTQGPEAMCGTLCGVLPDPIGVESHGFLLGQLSVHSTSNPSSSVRLIFHPPPS